MAILRKCKLQIETTPNGSRFPFCSGLHPGCFSDAEAEHCFRMAEGSKSDAPIRGRVHVPSVLRKKRQEYQQGDRSYAGHLTRYDALFWLTFASETDSA